MYRYIAQAIQEVLIEDGADYGLDVDALTNDSDVWSLNFGAADYEVVSDIKGHFYKRGGKILLPIIISCEMEHSASNARNLKNLDACLDFSKLLNKELEAALNKQPNLVADYRIDYVMFGYPYLDASLPGVYSFNGDIQFTERGQ
jgi:hypothetical protein